VVRAVAGVPPPPWVMVLLPAWVAVLAAWVVGPHAPVAGREQPTAWPSAARLEGALGVPQGGLARTAKLGVGSASALAPSSTVAAAAVAAAMVLAAMATLAAHGDAAVVLFSASLGGGLAVAVEGP